MNVEIVRGKRVKRVSSSFRRKDIYGSIVHIANKKKLKREEKKLLNDVKFMNKIALVNGRKRRLGKEKSGSFVSKNRSGIRETTRAFTAFFENKEKRSHNKE
jgi:hypothetical protein